MTADAIGVLHSGRNHSAHRTGKRHHILDYEERGGEKNIQEMFKTCFDVIFRSAYSQRVLKRNASSDETHIAVTLHGCVCICVWGGGIISSIGRAINIVLIIFSPAPGC